MTIPPEKLYRCVCTLYIEGRDEDSATRFLNYVSQTMSMTSMWARGILGIASFPPSGYWPTDFGWAPGEPRTMDEEIAEKWVPQDPNSAHKELERIFKLDRLYKRK